MTTLVLNIVSAVLIAGLLVNAAVWIVESADWDVENPDYLNFDCPGCFPVPYNESETGVTMILCIDCAPPPRWQSSVLDSGVRAVAGWGAGVMR